MIAVLRSILFIAAALLAGGCAPAMTGLVSPGSTAAVEIPASDRTLRWEQFPRDRDEKVFGPDFRARITNVRYELLIQRHEHHHEQGGEPTGPMFVRNLVRAEWPIPPDFEPGQVYGWAARARFDLDGRPRVTQWTSAGYGPTTAVGSSIPSFVVVPSRSDK